MHIHRPRTSWIYQSNGTIGCGGVAQVTGASAGRGLMGVNVTERLLHEAQSKAGLV